MPPLIANMGTIPQTGMGSSLPPPQAPIISPMVPTSQAPPTPQVNPLQGIFGSPKAQAQDFPPPAPSKPLTSNDIAKMRNDPTHQYGDDAAILNLAIKSDKTGAMQAEYDSAKARALQDPSFGQQYVDNTFATTSLDHFFPKTARDIQMDPLTQKLAATLLAPENRQGFSDRHPFIGGVNDFLNSGFSKGVDAIGGNFADATTAPAILPFENAANDLGIAPKGMQNDLSQRSQTFATAAPAMIATALAPLTSGMSIPAQSAISAAVTALLASARNTTKDASNGTSLSAESSVGEPTLEGLLMGALHMATGYGTEALTKNAAEGTLNKARMAANDAFLAAKSAEPTTLDLATPSMNDKGFMADESKAQNVIEKDGRPIGIKSTNDTPSGTNRLSIQKTLDRTPGIDPKSIPTSLGATEKQIAKLSDQVIEDARMQTAKGEGSQIKYLTSDAGKTAAKASVKTVLQSADNISDESAQFATDTANARGKVSAAVEKKFSAFLDKENGDSTVAKIQTRKWMDQFARYGSDVAKDPRAAAFRLYRNAFQDSIEEDMVARGDQYKAPMKEIHNLFQAQDAMEGKMPKPMTLEEQHTLPKPPELPNKISPTLGTKVAKTALKLGGRVVLGSELGAGINAASSFLKGSQ